MLENVVKRSFTQSLGTPENSPIQKLSIIIITKDCLMKTANQFLRDAVVVAISNCSNNKTSELILIISASF